jgi:hypothetical protein
LIFVLSYRICRAVGATMRICRRGRGRAAVRAIISEMKTFRAGHTPLEPLRAAVTGRTHARWEPHRLTVGSRKESDDSAGHLDQAWPGSGRRSIKEVAAGSAQPVRRLSLFRSCQRSAAVQRAEDALFQDLVLLTALLPIVWRTLLHLAQAMTSAERD